MARNIQEIRSTERGMFWIERFAMFLLVIFPGKLWCFHSAIALLVCTNSIYLSLFVDRLLIRPYPHDADDMFYIERFGIFCLSFFYTSSGNFAYYFWFIAAAYFIMTNVVYVIFCLEPTKRKILQRNSSHASTPIETDDDEELKAGEAKTDDEPSKEKLEDNQDGKWDEDRKCCRIANEDFYYGHLSSCWDLLKIEDVEHEVNHEEERTEIEDNLEGEKVTCHEEEPKKAEDTYDAELLETDEISNTSEESWENVEKKDEEKVAIDQEDELQELKAKCCDDMETWEDVEKKDEEKPAIDQEDELQELKAKCCDDMETWDDVEKKDEEKAAIDQEDEVQELKAKCDYLESELQELKAVYDECDVLESEKDSWHQGYIKVTERLVEEEIAKAVLESRVQSLVQKDKEHRLKWEEEKKELIANITATSACSTEKIIEATEQLQEMNHKLEEEKKDLYAKLEAVTASLEHYRGIENDFEEFEEERRKWNEEKEFYTLRFEACRRTIESLQSNANNQENQIKWDKERDDLTTKLAATNSCYQYYLRLSCDVSAKLEYYQTCYNEAEEKCRKLRDENLDLSTKLCAETSSAIYFHDRMHELDEKCRRLEEEKNNLTSKLCAEQASAELYRRCLHDFGA